MKIEDRLWDIGLLVAGGVLAAFGLFSPNAAPLWVVVGAVLLLIFVVRWRREWIGRWLGSYVAQYVYAPQPPPAPAPPDPAIERQREALGAVRDLVEGAMVHATKDRDHGNPKDRDQAIAAASRAFARVHELDNDETIALVTDWKRQFDQIPKGWKEASSYGPAGYPARAWAELRDAGDAAVARMGEDLRRMDRPAG